MGAPSEHEVRFASNMALVRRARGLSQQELADRIGVLRHVIAAAEIGIRHIRLGEACRIADALAVPLTELVADQPITIQLHPPEGTPS